MAGLVLRDCAMAQVLGDFKIHERTLLWVPFKPARLYFIGEARPCIGGHGNVNEYYLIRAPGKPDQAVFTDSSRRELTVIELNALPDEIKSLIKPETP